jgi:CheY-like chemotaxis protein
VRERILVVDDEMDIVDLFRQQFRQEIRTGSIAFEFAHDSRQALDILESNAPPDVMLILSDIDLPGMNGLDLLKRIKQQWPDLPVVMITSYGDAENRRRAADLGADNFLTKPIDFTELKHKLCSRLNFI